MGGLIVTTPAVGLPREARSWLLYLNIAGAAAHLAGIIVTLTVSRLNFGLVLYDIQPIYGGNTTHNRTDGSGEYVQHIFESKLVPALTIRPAWVCVIFFAFSFAAHATIVLSLAFTSSTWYMQGLANTRAPWRWLEYTASASIMFLLASPLLGQRHLQTIICQVALMAVTMAFGWLTEVFSSV